MKWTACTLREHDKNESVAMMNHELANEWFGTSNLVIPFYSGSHQLNLPLTRNTKRNNPSLDFPTSAFRALHIPYSSNIGIRKIGTGIEIGPWIGLLTAGSPRTSSQPFGARSNYIRSFLQSARSMGYYFAFTLNDINWHNRTIDGFMVDREGRWHLRTVPYPNVVHNRIPTRGLEQSKPMLRFQQELKRLNIPIFNAGFFDKWNVYSSLLRDSNAAKFIPETHLSPDQSMLSVLLSEQPDWYLKPINGCLGIGIYKLSKKSNADIVLQSTVRGKNDSKEFDDPNDVIRYLKRKHGTLKDYVIQEKVNLLRCENDPIDFRVHLNKTRSGDWAVSGIGSKRSAKNSVTTHVRNGGQLQSALPMLRKIQPQQAEHMHYKLEQTGIKIAQAIADESVNPVGELGIDLGIDQRNRIWMFEANAKPGRSIFKLPELKDANRHSFQMLRDYAVYLSETSNTTGGYDD